MEGNEEDLWDFRERQRVIHIIAEILKEEE
jgi:hypothetical protein